MTLTMDSPKLRELTRAQLQSLAKREGLRAVGKTETIIDRLMQKHPRGVPVTGNADNPSTSSTPPKRNVLKELLKGTLSPVPGTSDDHTGSRDTSALSSDPTMDSPKLRKLSRNRLQSLAKREGIRAIGKTEAIIRRLMRKHPRGVSVTQDADNLSASSAPPKGDVFKKSCEDIPPLTEVPATSEDRTDPKGKGKAVAEAAFPSPSSSTEALELLYPEDESMAGPFRTNPVPPLWITESEVLPNYPASFSEERLPGPSLEHPSHQAHNEDENTHSHAAPPEAPNPGWQSDEEGELDDTFDDVDYAKGAPNHYMVVDALRRFTTLVNTIPSMEERIAENRRLLQRTETTLEKAMSDARELVVTREYLETFLLAKMKQKRELWDGTARLEKQDRKLRMEWLRAQRKAENEKKWRETNALYEKNGLKPEPFSAFASQSDEEVIESLQTTPESSKSGSSKRPRGEDDDGDTDGDSDARRRKRARA